MIYNSDELPIFIINYLNYLDAVKNKSNKTIEGYYYDLCTFFKWFKIHLKLVSQKSKLSEIGINDLTIDQLKLIDLNNLHKFLSFAKNKLNNNDCARARKVACLRSFFKYICVIEKLLDINPAAELESPKLTRKLPKYLNLEESQSLLSSVDGNYSERDFAILTIFLNCGLRISELVGLNINDLKNNSATILGKGAKERKIYLNEACLNALQDYLKVRPKDKVIDKNALFLSKRKTRISVDSVQLIVKKYIKAAGLDPKIYSPHKLRHTFATLMYRYGNVSILALKQLLGHKDISTTEIYTHLEEKELEEAAIKNPLSGYRKE